MSWLDRLVDRQILKAQAEGKLKNLKGEGKLKNLKGEGKPLPDRPGDAFIAPGDAAGFRIMAESGVLPQEITLKKLAQAQRGHLATLTDAAERKAAMAELAQIELRQAIAQEARRKFLET